MGNQREIQYAGGEKVSYSYDLMGRLIEMAGEGQVMKHLYDPLGRLKERRRENGLIERYEYDGLGQLTKVLEAPGEGETAVVMNKYGYDPQGNVIQEFKRDIEGGAHQSISYGYDEVNRLTQAIEGHGYFERRYAYDSLGNLSLEIRDGETTKCSVDGLNRLVRKETGGKEGYSYAYDQRGNLILETEETRDKIIRSYEYDETNRMVLGRNESGGERTYRYNGLGVLVHKGGKERRDYVMDYTAYVPRPLIETGEGGITNSYAYDGRNLAWAEMDSNGEKVKLQYHNDRLGSTVKVTDSAGKIQAMANYDEWGTRTKVKKAEIAGMEFDLAAIYTGHEWDGALGMYHAKARMYDPGNKRFTAEDLVKGGMFGERATYSRPHTIDNVLYTLKHTGEYVDLESTSSLKNGSYYAAAERFINEASVREGTNSFTYANNNPMKFLDLTGLQTVLLDYIMDKYNEIYGGGFSYTENGTGIIVTVGNKSATYFNLKTGGMNIVESEELMADFGLSKDIAEHQFEDRYDNLDHVALAWSLTYFPKSNKEKVEYGSLFYQDEEGKFYYDCVSTGDSETSKKNPTVTIKGDYDSAVGNIHTHPHFPFSGRMPFEYDLYSTMDKTAAYLNQFPTYLATSNNKLKELIYKGETPSERDVYKNINYEINTLQKMLEQQMKNGHMGG